MTGEELGEQLTCVGSTDSAGHLDAMVETRVVAHVVEAVTGTGLHVSCAVDDPVDPAIEHGAGAHQAWLEREHQGAAVEAPRSNSGRRISQGEDLGVRRGIPRQFTFVVPTGENSAVAHHDCSHRHVAVADCGTSFVECQGHQFIVSHRWSIEPTASSAEWEYSIHSRVGGTMTQVLAP